MFKQGKKILKPLITAQKAQNHSKLFNTPNVSKLFKWLKITQKNSNPFKSTKKTQNHSK